MVHHVYMCVCPLLVLNLLHLLFILLFFLVLVLQPFHLILLLFLSYSSSSPTLMACCGESCVSILSVVPPLASLPQQEVALFMLFSGVALSCAADGKPRLLFVWWGTGTYMRDMLGQLVLIVMVKLL